MCFKNIFVWGVKQHISIGEFSAREEYITILQIYIYQQCGRDILGGGISKFKG